MAKEDKFIPNASIGKDGDQITMDRRGFLNWLTIGWLAFAAATGGFFTVMVRFLFPNVLFEPPQSFKIGYPEEFVPGALLDAYRRSEAGIGEVSTIEEEALDV